MSATYPGRGAARRAALARGRRRAGCRACPLGRGEQDVHRGGGGGVARPPRRLPGCRRRSSGGRAHARRCDSRGGPAGGDRRPGSRGEGRRHGRSTSTPAHPAARFGLRFVGRGQGGRGEVVRSASARAYRSLGPLSQGGARGRGADPGRKAASHRAAAALAPGRALASGELQSRLRRLPAPPRHRGRVTAGQGPGDGRVPRRPGRPARPPAVTRGASRGRGLARCRGCIGPGHGARAGRGDRRRGARGLPCVGSGSSAGRVGPERDAAGGARPAGPGGRRAGSEGPRGGPAGAGGGVRPARGGGALAAAGGRDGGGWYRGDDDVATFVAVVCPLAGRGGDAGAQSAFLGRPGLAAVVRRGGGDPDPGPTAGAAPDARGRQPDAGRARAPARGRSRSRGCQAWRRRARPSHRARPCPLRCARARPRAGRRHRDHRRGNAGHCSAAHPSFRVGLAGRPPREPPRPAGRGAGDVARHGQGGAWVACSGCARRGVAGRRSRAGRPRADRLPRLAGRALCRPARRHALAARRFAALHGPGLPGDRRRRADRAHARPPQRPPGRGAGCGVAPARAGAKGRDWRAGSGRSLAPGRPACSPHLAHRVC